MGLRTLGASPMFAYQVDGQRWCLHVFFLVAKVVVPVLLDVSACCCWQLLGGSPNEDFILYNVNALVAEISTSRPATYIGVLRRTHCAYQHVWGGQTQFLHSCSASLPVVERCTQAHHAPNDVARAQLEAPVILGVDRQETPKA